MKITSIILAGGNSQRLGRSKALEAIGGNTVIERVIEQLNPITNQLLMVISREQSNFQLTCKAEILVDIYPDKGPLGGIYTGLLASKSSRSLVVACDMPFLNTDLLRYMIELSDDFDAVVPRLREGMVEPLHAVYSKDCLSNIKTQLEHGHLRTDAVLNTLCVRYIERAECQRLDPHLQSFFNINYQSELEQATAFATKIEP